MIKLMNLLILNRWQKINSNEIDYHILIREFDLKGDLWSIPFDAFASLKHKQNLHLNYHLTVK